MLDAQWIELAIVATIAAVVNGTIGYGFSTIVLPVGLLWFSPKVLNPAVVLVELGVNLVLLYRERRFIRVTHARVRPMMVGAVPGVVVGAILFSAIAPSSLRVVVYVALLPLILLQLIGRQRTILNERPVGAAVGAGVGTLYALTTISGPPLALFWRNQWMAKGEFRCAMAQMRCVEGTMTLGAYALLGLYTPAATATVPWLLVPVLLGVPLGTLVLAGFTRGFFSKFVMAADAVVVAYGLATALVALAWLGESSGALIFVGIAVAVLLLAYREIRNMPFARLEPRLPDRSFEWDPGI